MCSKFAYSEIKRRLKAEQKLKEKAEKEAKTVTQAIVEDRTKTQEKKEVQEEDIAPNVSIYIYIYHDNVKDLFN